jgi:integrase
MACKRDLPPRCYAKHGAFFYVSPDGKWHNLGRDKDKALREYSRLVVNTKGLDVSRMTGLIDTALPLICHGKAKSTVKSYRQCAARLRAIFAEFGVEDVKPKHVAQVKVSMLDTPNLANRFLTVLRLLFTYAVEQQLCEWNPATGIKPYPEAKRTRLLSDAEVEQVLAHCPARLKALVGLLRVSGQRVSDVLRLRRSDLTDEGVVFVQAKTGARVTLRWTPDLRAAVDAALALHGPVKRLTVFYGRRNAGGPPGYATILKQWRKAVAASGVKDANLHDLRAVAVTGAHRQGLDAQALAGHSSAAMTKRYIRDKVGVVVTPPALSKKVSKSG